MQDAIDWESTQRNKLDSYAGQIRSCVDEERWLDLIEILDERLIFLENAFSKPLPIQYRDAAKRLINSVLTNDKEFQTQIQRKKNILAEQNLIIQRNSRAIQSYSELIP